LLWIKDSRMAETQMRLMTPEEFYQWQLDQDERYKLVEGVPVPLRAITGASNVHDVILINCIGQLYAHLRGKPLPRRQRRYGAQDLDPLVAPP
jgi:Uma2 family endonuclease